MSTTIMKLRQSKYEIAHLINIIKRTEILPTQNGPVGPTAILAVQPVTFLTQVVNSLPAFVRHGLQYVCFVQDFRSSIRNFMHSLVLCVVIVNMCCHTFGVIVQIIV